MKTIGMIGGMSWESTQTYYQVINETVRDRLGGLHSAKILMYSVDFFEIEHLQSTGEWDRNGQILSDIACRLEQAGADFIVIGANTMHKVVPAIEGRVRIPVLHIADAAAHAILGRGMHRAALLGTRYTMQEPFLRERLEAGGLEVIVPGDEDVRTINCIIYDELCIGRILPESRGKLVEIIEHMQAQGAECAILGCTELGMLVDQSCTSVPILDTTILHARAAAELALQD